MTGKDNAVAYDSFIIYMNGIVELMRSIGYERILMWNDDVYRDFDTGWQGATELDPSIDIQYWSVKSNGGKNNVYTYLDRGHKVYNFISPCVYYVVGFGGAKYGTTPEILERDWSAYYFDTEKPENNPPAPDPRILGGGYCLWSDSPASESEDEVLEHILPYIKACGKKLN